MATVDITRRLKRVEGQIRGLQRMVEDERDCEAILTQLMAARAALDGVGMLILDEFVARCLQTTDSAEAQQRVGRIVKLIFSRYSVPRIEEEPSQEKPAEPGQEE